ncbi:MAG: prepilin-type N-terminal cleavage/methylation domain-containing protein [Hyphomicrobium sp.]|nr:prepilin-type N-terminal cleavage/methylation domain-containing protein [Hyphomicrobium sp.]
MRHAPLDEMHHSEGGFTLVEALVVFVLVAIIFAMAPGALRLGQQSMQATMAASSAADRLAALDRVEGWIASARPIFERDRRGLAQIAFAGEPDRIVLVSEIPNGPSGGGLYHIVLDARRAAGSSGLGLELTIAPYRDTSGSDETDAFASSAPALSPVSRTIARGYDHIGFRFFGTDPATGSARWLDQWPHTDRLPRLVEVSLRPKSGRANDSAFAPTKVVALQLAQK